MKYLTLIIVAVSLIFLSSCSSDDSTKQQETGNVKSNFQIAVSAYLDSSYKNIYNTNKEFILSVENGNPDESRKFLVFDVEADSVILKDNLLNGEIKWIDDYNISVVEFPGMIQKNDESIKSKYKYNVLRKIKYN